MSREQAAIDTNNLMSHVFDYSALALQTLYFVPKPQNILLIGLGAGVITRHMALLNPMANIDVIEIDPDIIRIAQEYFCFQATTKTVIRTGDAYAVVPTLPMDYYDLVSMDTFTTGYIPYHLMCFEFFKMLLARMTPKSILAINANKEHPSFLSHVRTIMEVMGDNIYFASGRRCPTSTTLYILRQGDQLYELNKISLPDVEQDIPCEMKITDEIANAPIFRLSAV
jgi:spermidine synthase